jgi:hypothetical protein
MCIFFGITGPFISVIKIYYLNIFKPQEMKKIFTLIAVCALTTAAFAQSPICPSAFRRNNGNGSCPTAKLTFIYPVCPNPALTIDSILVDGVNTNVTVTFISCVNGKVEYCVSGGNLPQVSVMQVFFSNAGAPGTGFGCFVPESGPLPVKLSVFNAQRADSKVNLSWTSEIEINSDRYVIQRKLSTDADFVDIATVASANAANGAKYSYVDVNNSRAISQYRILMVDKDASFAYSSIKPVKGFGSAVEFTVFPNPSYGAAKVSVSDVQEGMKVQLIDNTGRILRNISMKTTNQVDINGLQNGMYILRVTNEATGETESKRLTVIK